MFEGRLRIGRIRLAAERMPCVWLWSVTIHLTGDLPMGSFQDLNTATEGPSRMEGDPMITDKDCDYQAGPSIENKQRHEALAATVGRVGKPRGEALDYCRGRTTTVSMYSKLHTGWRGSAKPSI